MLEILNFLKGSLKMTVILTSPPQITSSAMPTIVVNLKIDVSMFKVANNTTGYSVYKQKHSSEFLASNKQPVVD